MAVSDFTDEVQVKVFRSHVKIPVIFLVPAAMLATLYCVVYFYANSNYMLEELPRVLHQVFGGSFQVEELVLDPSLTGAHVYGAQIRETPDDEAIVDAPEAHVEVEPVFLFVGRVVFSKGVARGAHVRLEFDQEGEINLLQALSIERDKKPRDDKRPIAVNFRSLEAENCSLTFIRPKFEFEIPDIDLPQGSIDVGRDELRMRVPDLNVRRVDMRFRPEMFHFEPDYGDWTFSLENIAIHQWEWWDRGFRVERASFDADGAHGELEGRMDFPLDFDDEPDMNYRGRGELSIPYWSPLAQYFVRDTAHFSVPMFQIAVEGSLDYIDGRMRARADVLETAGITFTDVYGEAELHDQYIELTEGSAQFYGGTIDADWAFFDMLEVEYGGAGSLSGVNPAEMLTAYDVELPALAGSLSGSFEAYGAVPMGGDFDIDHPLPTLTDARRELAEVTATSDWTFRRANREWLPVSEMTLQKGAELAVDYERVKIPDAQIDVPGGQFHVDHFELDYDRMIFESPWTDRAVDIRANISNIEPWFETWGYQKVGGELTGEFWANGPLAAPRAGLHAEIDAPEIPVGKTMVKGSSGVVDARIDDGRLTLDRLDFDSSAGNLRARGYVDLADAGGYQPLRFDYQASDVDLTILDAVAGGVLGASGKIDVKGGATGSVARPTLTYDATIDKGEVTWFTFRDFALKGAIGRRSLRVDRLESLVAETGKIAASGEYGFGSGAYDFQLDIAGLELAETTYLAAIDESYRPHGVIDLQLHGEGSLDKPSVAGDIELHDMKVGNRALGDLALVANSVDDTLYVSGAALPVGTIGFELPFSGNRGYHATFGVEHLDFARVFPEVGSLEIVDHLVATGVLQVDMARDFSDYVVSVNMSDVRIETPSETIRTRGPLRASFDSNHRLQIEEATIGSRGHYVEVRGGMLLDSYLTSMRIVGELDLALVDLVGNYLFPDVLPATLVDSQGVVSVDMDIGGPPSRPIPSGTLTIQDAEFTLRDFTEPLRLNSGKIEFDRTGVVIPEADEIDGEVMGGVFSLSGNLDIEDYRPQGGRFEVWSHNLMYRVRDTANLTFDTDVTVEADDIRRPETWLVSGQVEILNALYYRNISLFEQELTGRVIGTFARRAERFEAGLLEQYPWIGDVQFDVDLRARDGFVIQSQIDRFDLDIEFRIDLQLQRTLADPRLSGEIDVISGEVEFQGETFTVRTGSIEYTGNPQNPRVEITASADIQNRCVETDEFRDVGPTFGFTGDFDDTRQEIYHVLLTVEGRLDTLDIQFESNPYADQRDILSLMLTGCTVDELTASSATQPTLEIALGPLLGRIEKEVQNVVKLSEFTIMPGVERTQVRIADQFSRRLRWRFQLDTGLSERAGGQRYQLEYQLSDRWSAEFSERSTAQQENFLLDVKLKYRIPLD